MPKTVFAIHKIHHNPTGGQIEEVLPGTIFDCLDKDYDFFIAAEAVRDPKEAELALHEQQKARAAESVEASAAADQAAKEAADKAAADAADKAAAKAAAAAAKEAAKAAGAKPDSDPVG